MLDVVFRVVRCDIGWLCVVVEERGHVDDWDAVLARHRRMYRTSSEVRVLSKRGLVRPLRELDHDDCRVPFGGLSENALVRCCGMRREIVVVVCRELRHADFARPGVVDAELDEQEMRLAIGKDRRHTKRTWVARRASVCMVEPHVVVAFACDGVALT